MLNFLFAMFPRLQKVISLKLKEILANGKSFLLGFLWSFISANKKIIKNFDAQAL